MGNLQSRITENCDEEDHEKDLISKMSVGISIFYIRTCACMCVYLHVLYFGWVDQ